LYFKECIPYEVFKADPEWWESWIDNAMEKIGGYMNGKEQAAKNTDRELWREPPGDYYANRIFVTEGGGIGIDVGGFVIVKPLADWHALAKAECETPRKE